MNATSDFVKVVSNDGHEFLLESKLAPRSLLSSSPLPYSARVIEKLIQYIYFKGVGSPKTATKRLVSDSKFDIPPSLGLDLLKAAIELDL